ncbi:MAG: type IV secretory system conjugative DNA transfer family protein [Pseudomonadota bacterium]
MFVAPSYAQFDGLLSDTLAAQQDNINTLSSQSVATGLDSIFSQEQLNQLTAEQLLNSVQSGEEGVEEQALPAPTRSLDANQLLQDFENTQDILQKYGGGSAFSRAENAPPLSLDALENIRKENVVAQGEGLPFDIRKDAIKEAAISYGARGGLAWRTYAISQDLGQRSRYLNRVFDFRQLLIPAPSGLLIEPPIISESVNSMLIEVGGQEAAVSDRIYNIINNARIVSAPRTWRTYLERSWPAVEPPPDILRPEGPQERALWVEYVNIGWQAGVEQANDIFKEDIALLLSDFRGMVRYRLLLSQGMISAPFALQVDRGVTGGGSQMRVGDRAVQITGVPQLITGASRWKPASR